MPRPSLPRSEDETGLALDLEVKDKRKSIQSVEAGVEVLKALVTAQGSAALRDVSAATGMSRSQTYRYLLAYVNTGFVRQDPITSKYSLGPLALRIGLAALGQIDATARASEGLELLAETTGRTGLLAVWAEGGPTIIRWVHGRQRVVTSLSVGSSLPLLFSTSGHIFLSYMPARVTMAMALQEWSTIPHQPGERVEDLLQNIRKEVRAKGYAAAAGTVVPGLCAIGAPVLDSQGEAVACITLLARAGEPLEEDTACVDAMLRTAEKISQNLGWFGSFATPGHAR